MSALGSSVINKSGRRFAPKAPARRPAVPASTQASPRPSHDRQTQSQTAQPQQQTERPIVSPTPSVYSPTPARTQRAGSAAPDGEAQAILAPLPRAPASESNASDDNAAPLSTASRSIPAQKNTSPAPGISQKRPSERPSELSHISDLNATSQTVQSNHIARPAHKAAAPKEPNLLYSDFSSTARFGSTLGEGAVSDISERSAVAATADLRAIQENTHASTAKRRRINKSPVHPSGAKRNVPLPTSDNDEAGEGELRNAEPDSAKTQPAQAKKPRLSAQAKRMQRIEDEAAAIVTDATRNPSSKAKRPRKLAKVKTVHRNGDEASEAAAGVPTSRGKPAEHDAASAQGKRKRKINQIIQNAATEIVEEAVLELSKNPKKRGYRGRQRAATPEGADAVVIAPSEVRMSDLCKDSRTGRKSEREKDLAELERAELARKKQKEMQEVMGHLEPDNEPDSSGSAIARVERLGRQREQEESVAENVPNTIIVNGQIQIDEDSLQIDRHAAAAAARADEVNESVEENALTRKVNSASWLKRDKSGGWNEDLTEQFYKGLRMFGTDFEMISKMFSGRTRHKIKLKFVKEEKLNHDKIKATLLGEKTPVDLPEYQEMAGVEFDDPQELERDMEEDRKRLEEETLAEKAEMESARRERDEQIAAERAAAGEESSAKENRRGKSKRKKDERHKVKKGGARRREKHSGRGEASGGTDVLGDIPG